MYNKPEGQARNIRILLKVSGTLQETMLPGMWRTGSGIISASLLFQYLLQIRQAQRAVAVQSVCASWTVLQARSLAMLGTLRSGLATQLTPWTDFVSLSP